MRAIETLETLAARAAESGLVDVQVRALLDQSFLLLWINAERCLEAAQRALYLSAEQVPAMRTRTRTTCVFQRIVVRGWNARDALEFREGLAEIVNIHRVPAVAYELLEDSFIRWISGEYREGLRLALEVRAKLLEPKANPNLSFDFERAGALQQLNLLFLGGWGEALKEYAALAPLNLIFLGEWGEALKELALGIAQAQKNANYHYTLMLRVYEAWLHLHALHFKGVLAICESALPQMRDPALRTTSGRPAAYAMQLRTALICSGSASVALGDYARALDDFSTVASDMEHEMVFLDWYGRMPLAAGLTELWLAKGDRTRARLEAERFLDLSLATAERTWHGLAWEANARVALTNRDHTRARECIEEAVSVVEGFEVPLATWRVHATAAHIEEESGNSEPARSHREISRATILRLANSLPEEEPLRKIFLSAPAVAQVLNRDS
jgi:tetratricopeptide (TPR) repeat protein